MSEQGLLVLVLYMSVKMGHMTRGIGEGACTPLL